MGFITIKVIENFENSPENPDKFSHVDPSEEDRREYESFENLSNAVSKTKLPEQTEDLRDDLVKFDREIIRKNEEEKEEKEMIESIDKMIEKNEELKEFGKELIEENVPDMDALNEEMKKVELDEEDVKEDDPIVDPVLVEEPKKVETVLDENNIKELASHLSESMMMDNSIDKKAELESKIGDILNATLSQINKKFEKKQKKMEKKKNKQKTKKYY